MTNPKSPEVIMKEFEEYKELLNDHKNFEKGEYEGDSAKVWLRSSMASLLCYMVERMPEDSEKYLNHAFREGYERGMQGFRTFLIEEARKITGV